MYTGCIAALLIHHNLVNVRKETDNWTDTRPFIMLCATDAFTIRCR